VRARMAKAALDEEIRAIVGELVKDGVTVDDVNRDDDQGRRLRAAIRHLRECRGNSRTYWMLRLSRDRPDIADQWVNGEIKSAAAAARAAGLRSALPVNRLHGAATRLIQAWDRAPDVVRSYFLRERWTAIDRLHQGVDRSDYERATSRPRPGPPAWRRDGDPELERFIEEGMTVADLAKAFGVTYRTVARWRSGKSKRRRKLENE
jgi:hypothetical protein